MDIYLLDGSRSSLGKRSIEKLQTVNNDLQFIVTELSKWMDITVISGQRGMLEQNILVEDGRSKLKYPLSKHNRTPLSAAVDIAPYNKNINGIDWNDITAFAEMVRLVKIIASTIGTEIVCGADWKSFRDYPHIELKE